MQPNNQRNVLMFGFYLLFFLCLVPPFVMKGIEKVFGIPLISMSLLLAAPLTRSQKIVHDIVWTLYFVPIGYVIWYYDLYD